MPEQPFDYSDELSEKKLQIVASALIAAGGITLAFCAQRYSVSEGFITDSLLELIGGALAIGSSVVLINKIDQ